MNSGTFTTIDDDSSMNPTGTMGCVVKKIRNGNRYDFCVCTNESVLVAAGKVASETELYTITALKWRTDSDSTDYCEDLPCSRPS